MGLLTTALVVGAGAAAFGAVSQAQQARKGRKQQEAEMRRQQTEAREAAALRETREDSGADIELGVEEGRDEETRRRRRRRTEGTPRQPVVGGLFNAMQPSAVGGLR